MTHDEARLMCTALIEEVFNRGHFDVADELVADNLYNRTSLLRTAHAHVPGRG